MKTKVVKKKASKSTPMKDYEVQVERTSIVLSVYTTTVKARGPHYARKVALIEAESMSDTIEWSDTGNEKDTFRAINITELNTEHDIVALNEDLPDSNLIKDDKGAIVHVYKNNAAYEVEFPREGTAPIVITLQSFQIRKIKGGTNG